MEAMIEFGDMKLHEEWFVHFSKVIRENSLISAAVLLGSFAKGSADRLSDFDLVVFSERSHLANVSDQLFNHKIFRPVHEWKHNYSEHHIFGKFIYENLVSAEIHVLSLDNEFKIRKPFLAIKDVGNLLTSRLEEGEPPKHADYDALPSGIDGLGWELFDMLKWFERGEVELVKSHIKKIVSRF